MFTNLIFPRYCLGCEKKGRYICPSCLSYCNYAKRFCPLCKKPSDWGLTHKDCKKYTKLDGVVCTYKYEGVVRQTIQQLKYKFAYDIAEELAVNVVNSTRFEPILLNTNVLVPIPLSKKRKRWRGFNQTEELGKLISERLKIEYLPVLEKTKDTKSQVDLSLGERKTNLRGVFSIKPEHTRYLKGKRIVLFDDVFTTGSTLFEASKAIYQAQPKAVFGFTVAG